MIIKKNNFSLQILNTQTYLAVNAFFPVCESLLENDSSTIDFEFQSLKAY